MRRACSCARYFSRAAGFRGPTTTRRNYGMTTYRRRSWIRPTFSAACVTARCPYRCLCLTRASVPFFVASAVTDKQRDEILPSAPSAPTSVGFGKIDSRREWQVRLLGRRSASYGLSFFKCSQRHLWTRNGKNYYPLYYFVSIKKFRIVSTCRRCI